MTPETAHLIAYVAHGAIGQKRADGITPYITHPERVEELTVEFSRHTEYHLRNFWLDDRRVGAYLHDVLEDTKLRAVDLLHLGITPKQLDIVQRMTLPEAISKNGSKLTEERRKELKRAYYQGISESLDTLVVKCADRCSNLEDSLLEVKATHEVRRWGKYVAETYEEVLPMYHTMPLLRAEIVKRLEAIEAELPAAIERRAQEVAKKRNSVWPEFRHLTKEEV